MVISSSYNARTVTESGGNHICQYSPMLFIIH